MAVESGGVDLGATFTVRLPVAQKNLDARVISQEITNQDLRKDSWRWECGESLAGQRVLVVEDDHDSCQLLVAILGRCNAEVRVAVNAIEALEILEEWRPDVIVSDIEMPVMNGFEFIRNVRNRKSLANIPAVALTAYTRVEDRLRALSSGFQMHLAKPADPAELLAVVASLTKRIGRN